MQFSRRNDRFTGKGSFIAFSLRLKITIIRKIIKKERIVFVCLFLSFFVLLVPRNIYVCDRFQFARL